MKVIEKVNFIWAALVTVLSAVLGRYWYLFAAFLALNTLDYITGVIKAKRYKKENSAKGLDGVVKKLGYWVVIAIAFFLARGFTELGAELGFNLGFTIYLGWFVLATLIINEVRSVLENLVAMGVELPAILTKGLEIADKRLNDITGGKDE